MMFFLINLKVIFLELSWIKKATEFDEFCIKIKDRSINYLEMVIYNLKIMYNLCPSFL